MDHATHRPRAPLVTGAALVWMTFDVMRVEDSAFNMKVLGTFLGAGAVYMVLQFFLGRLHRLNV